MKKNPWIAAVLNFFFMGLGTLYIGRRKLTGLGLTLGAIAKRGVVDFDASIHFNDFSEGLDSGHTAHIRKRATNRR